MYSYIAKFESANFCDDNIFETVVKSDNPLNDSEVLALTRARAETYFMEFDHFDWYDSEDEDPEVWARLVSIEEA